MIFAVSDQSPLSLCINCSFLHLYLPFYYQFCVGYLVILHNEFFFENEREASGVNQSISMTNDL